MKLINKEICEIINLTRNELLNSKNFIEDLNKLTEQYNKNDQDNIKNEFLSNVFTNFISDQKSLNNINMNYSFLIKNQSYSNLYSSNSRIIKEIKITFIKNFLNIVKICPYCGKNPLIYFGDLNKDFSTKEDNRRTFHLDHFFPKNKYPNIGLNLYNLIPSCSSCNHLKSINDPLEFIDNGTIFHPYFGWIYKSKDVINIENIDFSSKINFNNLNIFKNNHFMFFNLTKIYLNSQDTKSDIWFIRDKIEKIQVEKNNIKSFGCYLNNEKLYNNYFQYYCPQNENEILLYTNGKLKMDIIEKLKAEL